MFAVHRVEKCLGQFRIRCVVNEVYVVRFNLRPLTDLSGASDLTFEKFGDVRLVNSQTLRPCALCALPVGSSEKQLRTVGDVVKVLTITLKAGVNGLRNGGGGCGSIH